MTQLKYVRNIIGIFDQLQVGVVITNPRVEDNPIIYVNDYVQDLTGYKEEELLNKNCRFMQKDDKDQEEIKEIRKAIKEKRSCLVTLRNYKKDGKMFYNELLISPLFDEQGNLVYFVGVQKDVTMERLFKENLITKEILQEKEIEKLNLDLTKLLNQRV